MITENQEVIFCPEDDEYRVYCDICDKLCTERYYRNHLESQTHTKIIQKNHLLIRTSSHIPFKN